MENQVISGASFHRGVSKQDYGTPWNFIHAVENKFGVIAFDLAADLSNTKASCFFSERDNSLIKPWHKLAGLLWINPPFSNIEPWASKCREEGAKGAHILFLVPASVGSVWFANHVHNHAFVYFLRPRLSFDGKQPFPKDCVLCEYATPRIGYDIWKWK